MILTICDDRLWSQMVARAWSDEAFMERLRLHPRSVLADYGVEAPLDTEIVEGAEARVAEEGDSLRLVLPAGPPDDLMEEDLVGDGAGWYCAACGRCGACGCRCACRCRCVE